MSVNTMRKRRNAATIRRNRRVSPYPDGTVSHADLIEIGWGWGGFMDTGAIEGRVTITPSFGARISVETSIAGAIRTAPK